MRILITAGPTREHLDTVRFLSNSSSGRMGYAIAAEGIRRGHQVVLVSGPVDRPAPRGVLLESVTSAAEMFDACVRLFADCDAAVMAAAVCDYAPARPADRKLEKKTDGPLIVELHPTRDICAHLGAGKGHRVVVGFAMEDHDHHAHAEAKLQRKRCDAIVMNDRTSAGRDEGTIEILAARRGWRTPVSGSKDALARVIVDLVESLMSGAAG
jgi:phosphopantothenoylcysteine decarboxylase/phosphopantothenate--cysteine ligase